MLQCTDSALFLNPYQNDVDVLVITRHTIFKLLFSGHMQAFRSYSVYMAHPDLYSIECYFARDLLTVL